MRPTNSTSNNVSQFDFEVNSDTSTRYNMLKSEKDTSLLKEKQLEIIKTNNPVYDDYHTWIRNIEDIKTLEETINDSDWSESYKFKYTVKENGTYKKTLQVGDTLIIK